MQKNVSFWEKNGS
jgi:hypothetical protein